MSPARPTKDETRDQMRRRREAMSPDEVAAASAAIRARLLALPLMQTPDAVFTYVSTGAEVDTHGLIRELLARGVAVWVPRITGPGRMDAARLHRFEDLRPGRHGILAPPADASDAPDRPDPPEQGPAAAAISPAVTIVPGLAFDRRGHRLGRRGGYYDRFLAEHPAAVAIGLAYDWQIVDALPDQPHDRPVRWIVTDQRVIDTRPKND